MSSKELIATDFSGIDVLYNSISEASKECEVSESDIYNAEGTNRYVGGFRWNYVRESRLTYDR